MGIGRARDESNGDVIRKGPWKAGEDEVLINHVKKYGPRDWSSIRSKGLLQRTGKSCRLRWVNKLRPNLKNGVKFSGEEERVVIELQGQFGNKWARIARYLPGRTDNDVKNFWSSRQKRLARILQTPTPPKSSKKSNKELVPPAFHPTSMPEAPKCGFSLKEESFSMIQSSSSSSSSFVENPEMIKMLALPDLVNPNRLNFETQPEDNPTYKTSGADSQEGNPFFWFPEPQHDISFPLLSQEVSVSLDNPNFLDVFGARDACELGNGRRLSLGLPPFLALEQTCQDGITEVNSSPMTPDSFFDDFPTDMFDHIEPLPSPTDS